MSTNSALKLYARAKTKIMKHTKRKNIYWADWPINGGGG